MTEEKINRNKRRATSLTIEEWLRFFFVPVNISKGVIDVFPTNDFNDTEENRFRKFNFDKKLKQSYQARFLGVFFYFVLIFAIILY